VTDDADRLADAAVEHARDHQTVVECTVAALALLSIAVVVPGALALDCARVALGRANQARARIARHDAGSTVALLARSLWT
jgi:hypothetical protein